MSDSESDKAIDEILLHAGILLAHQDPMIKAMAYRIKQAATVIHNRSWNIPTTIKDAIMHV